MIKSFSCKKTEAVWNGKNQRSFPETILRRAFRKLKMLAAATVLDDLRFPPGNHLEQLQGDRNGQHSIRINDQYRVCFVWDDQHAHGVEIVDYH